MTNYEMITMAGKSFIGDWEKMRDFYKLTREEFLSSYSYLTEEEYDATVYYDAWLSKQKLDNLMERTMKELEKRKGA